MNPTRIRFALRRPLSMLATVGLGVFLQAGLGSIATAGDAPPVATNAFVVRDVRVFDGTRTINATDVVVRDGRIAAIGRGAKAEGLPVVDGHGRTLLPGLIDAHTHTYGAASQDALRFGVTTELDMFTDWHLLADAKRRRMSFAKTDRADLFSAGTLATAPGGHGTEYGFAIPTLTGPDQAAAFVDARLAEGSDYLKIILEDGSIYGHPIPTIDVATLNALVAAAHARQRIAVAHVATQVDAQHAVAAGVDGLAHVFLDQPADAAMVASLKRHGTFVVATLSVAASVAGAEAGAKLATDARLQPFLSIDQRRMLDASFPASLARPAFLANATESVRRLHAAGVPVLAGTDAGNPGTTHGATLHDELALLVAAGLTPRDALTAATALPSRFFSLADRGRIAPGLRADLLLVDGDPTTNIDATRAIVTIWKNGYVVDRTAPVVSPAVAGAPVPADPVVADFEDGTAGVRYGQPWVVTTDALAGGQSTATQAWIAGGADGSKGALRVGGTVAAGAIYTWAGTMFAPGGGRFEPMDYTGRDALVFKVRGDGRDDVAMIFSGASAGGIPATVPFKTTAEWTEVRIPLARFPGIDRTRIRGLAFTAGNPVGDFWFEIDDVSVR